MPLDTKQKELITKLLGMLGSDFDGERAVAAKKVSDIAKAQKVSIVELMRLCFIQEQGYRWSPPPPPPPPPPPNQKQRSNTNSGKWNTSEDDLADQLLGELNQLFEEHGPEPLSAWEANFVNDICDRSPSYLSEKQIAVIERILVKLRKCKTGAF
jgi:hypothetical protein